MVTNANSNLEFLDSDSESSDPETETETDATSVGTTAKTPDLRVCPLRSLMFNISEDNRSYSPDIQPDHNSGPVDPVFVEEESSGEAVASAADDHDDYNNLPPPLPDPEEAPPPPLPVCEPPAQPLLSCSVESAQLTAQPLAQPLNLLSSQEQPDEEGTEEASEKTLPLESLLENDTEMKQAEPLVESSVAPLENGQG